MVTVVVMSDENTDLIKAKQILSALNKLFAEKNNNILDLYTVLNGKEFDGNALELQRIINSTKIHLNGFENLKNRLNDDKSNEGYTIISLLAALYNQDDARSKADNALILLENKLLLERIKLAGSLLDKAKLYIYYLILVLGIIAAAQSNNILSVIEWGLHTFQVIPDIGLAFSLAASLYFFYNNYTDIKLTTLRRLHDSSFITLNVALKIAAYVTKLVTLTAMSPTIGGLLVAASVIEVIKETSNFIQEYANYKMIPEPDINATRNFEKNRNALLISIAAAVLLVAITAVWCFVPGSLALTLAAGAAMVSVYLIKFALIKINEKMHQKQLLNEAQSIQSAVNSSEEIVENNKLNNATEGQKDSQEPSNKKLRFFDEKKPTVSEDVTLDSLPRCQYPK